MRAAVWLALAAIVASVAVIAASAVLAAELTPQEAAGCQAEGGCEVVSHAWLRSQLAAAFSSGYAEGKASVKCARPTI